VRNLWDRKDNNSKVFEGRGVFGLGKTKNSKVFEGRGVCGI
jgi:hypothetical protein